MMSADYKIEQNDIAGMEPTHEWHRPQKLKEFIAQYPGYHQHVMQGGLVLRTRTGSAVLCNDGKYRDSDGKIAPKKIDFALVAIRAAAKRGAPKKHATKHASKKRRAHDKRARRSRKRNR